MLYIDSRATLYWLSLLFAVSLLIVISLPLQTSGFRNSGSSSQSLLTGISVQSDIGEWLQADSDLSLFTEALEKADLLKVIVHGQSFFVFAPTNQALQDEGSAFLLEEIMVTEDLRVKLLDSLKMHIVENPPSELFFRKKRLSKKELLTLSGRSIALKKISSRYFVGRNAFVTKIVHTQNGVVFYTDSLLLANQG